MEVARHVQIVQNRKLIIFLQYIFKKKVLQLLLCSIVIQNYSIVIFLRGPTHVRCHLLLFLL